TTLTDSAFHSSTSGQNITFTASVTSNGSPVSEGTVDFSSGGILLSSVSVDLLGHARFSATPSAGTYTVTASYHDSFISQTYASSSDSDTVSVTATPPVVGGVLSGTVFHDFNANSAQDPGEPGLVGQPLYIDLDNTGQFKTGDPTATTDANGSYQFTGLN